MQYSEPLEKFPQSNENSSVHEHLFMLTILQYSVSHFIHVYIEDRFMGKPLTRMMYFCPWSVAWHLIHVEHLEYFVMVQTASCFAAQWGWGCLKCLENSVCLPWRWLKHFLSVNWKHARSLYYLSSNSQCLSPHHESGFSLYPVLTHNDDESHKAANLNLMSTIE